MGKVIDRKERSSMLTGATQRRDARAGYRDGGNAPSLA